MLVLGRTLDIIGKVMVAYTALRVHHRVWKEHEISKMVFSEMRKEQIIGVVGIAFMLAGYLIEVSSHLL